MLQRLNLVDEESKTVEKAPDVIPVVDEEEKPEESVEQKP